MWDDVVAFVSSATQCIYIHANVVALHAVMHVCVYRHGLCVVMPPIDPIYIHGSDYVGIFMLLCIAFVL